MYDMTLEQLEELEQVPGDAHDLRGAARGDRRPSRLATPEEVQRKLRALKISRHEVLPTADASFDGRLEDMQARVDHGANVLIVLPELASIRECEIRLTTPNGVKTRKGYTGYARYLTCKDGDVYVRDMLLENVRVSTVKELSNVRIGSSNGYLYAFSDPAGNAYTRLTWVANNIHHVADKQGVGDSVQAWLLDYANELYAIEQ